MTMSEETSKQELPELDEMLAEKHSAYMGTVILSPSSKAIYDVAQEPRTGLLAALRESREKDAEIKILRECEIHRKELIAQLSAKDARIAELESKLRAVSEVLKDRIRAIVEGK